MHLLLEEDARCYATTIHDVIIEGIRSFAEEFLGESRNIFLATLSAQYGI